VSGRVAVFQFIGKGSKMGYRLPEERASDQTVDVGGYPPAVSQMTAAEAIGSPAILRSVWKLKQAVEAMRVEANALTVNDDPSLVRSIEMEGQAKKIRGQISKAVTNGLKPFKDAEKNLRSKVNPVVKAVDQIINHLNSVRRVYAMNMEKERIRKAREAEEAHRAEEKRRRDAMKAVAEGVGLEAIPPMVTQTEAAEIETKVETASGTMKIVAVYKAELIDVRALSDDCIRERWDQIVSAVMPYANAKIRAGIHEIPGFRVERSDEMKTRAK
jgi:hypothetical protein